MKWYKEEVKFTVRDVLVLATLWGIVAICNIIQLFK